MAKGDSYLAIDLKSFYASVECVERGLDPMATNLVVADVARTEKTICLAVSPSLKAYGIPGRARLFEVVQRVRQINQERQSRAPKGAFSGSSCHEARLLADPSLALDYIAAVPRMALYMAYSARIYQIYLEFVAPEDIHPYSIDEVFIDATHYLKTYGVTARQLCARMIRRVMEETGITATGGIGDNLYLCKIAMDIVAKHIPADEEGLRIAQLDEISYRRLLWTHRPLTDFWRVGPGYARKLESRGIFTMGDIARLSLENEELLYQLFGVNAQLLIDHAWGYESVRMEQIKAYRPRDSSVGSGQVLQHAYDAEGGRLILREMADSLALGLVDKGLAADQLVLAVGYDRESLADPQSRERLRGETVTDRYGRQVPRPAHGSVSLGRPTSSISRIVEAATGLYDRIVDPAMLIRRINITAAHVTKETETLKAGAWRQMELFADEGAQMREERAREKEKRAAQAVLEIQKRFGKNAILKGMNLREGATGRERNRQIGGHKA